MKEQITFTVSGLTPTGQKRTFRCVSFGSFNLTYNVFVEQEGNLDQIGKVLGFFSEGSIKYSSASRENVIGEKTSCPCKAFFELVENYKKENDNERSQTQTSNL